MSQTGPAFWYLTTDLPAINQTTDRQLSHLRRL